MNNQSYPLRWIVALAVVVGAASLDRVFASSPVSPGLAVSPPLAIVRDGPHVQISFNGILQSADSLEGPWIDLTNAVSPHVADLSAAARRYFRNRETSPGGVFSARTVLNLTITGPFQQHFDLALAGVPDGFFPPHREKAYFDGVVQLNGTDLPVSVRVRGNSSLQECPFPKLKFKVSKENRPGTPFADAREVKLGTHCADGGRGNVGRLRDEIAAAREVLAYEVMEQLGFVAPRVRRALVEYRDTSPDHGGNPVGWRVTRHAALLDDIEVVAERLGARVLTDEEVAKVTAAEFDAQLVVDLQLLHVLLGNWDYSLATGGRGVWNADVLEFPDGRRLPVAGDFDLASWVTGSVRGAAPRDYHPELGDVEREARYQVEQLRGRVEAAQFASARDRFTNRRAAIETGVASAFVDEPGRANAARHLAGFFAALTATER